MKYIKKFFRFLLNHKYWSTTFVVLLIIILLIMRFNQPKTNFDTFTAIKGNVVETVSVTGTISPIDKADLSFEKGGVVSKILVKVGDNVKSGDVIGMLDNASDNANLQSAEATLRDISRGLRPEELGVEQAKVAAAKITLVNSEKDAINAAHDAYVKTQSALFNYTDSLFDNPQSTNPTILIPTRSYVEQSTINYERVTVSGAFDNWLQDLSTASLENSDKLLSNSHDHLVLVKAFVNHLYDIIANLNGSNSGLSQTVISNYIVTVNMAQSVINQAIDSITSAQTALDTASSAFDEANSSFSLKLAGSSPDAIAAQSAKVNQALAELAKDTIISPIDGVITNVIPNLGEFVTAGQIIFSVQSIGNYKIEAFVPEADIVKVKINDLASTTLDAYGSNTNFPAIVTAIDPAETVLEGVPTYKVTLHFVGNDNRVRSGMTANLDILTHEKDNVIAIPYRAVVNDNDKQTVRVLSPDGNSYTSVPIETGLKGSDGLIEIISGVSLGDKVVTYIK